MAPRNASTEQPRISDLPERIQQDPYEVASAATREMDAAVAAKPIGWGLEFIPGQIATNSYYGPLLQNYLRSLPRPSDDVERDLGLDIYEKMLNDPTVSSAIRSLKIQALSSGVRFVGKVPKPSAWNTDQNAQAEYAHSEEIRAGVEAMMDELQQPLSAIVSDMLDCLAFGHSLAELVFQPDGNRLVLQALRVKNRYRYSYVTDRFLQCVGIVPTEKASGIIPVEWVIPRAKFWHLTTETHQADPRGRSLLRAAYNAWWLKQQAWQDYFKYLKQYATPSLAALLDNDAPNVTAVDASGNVQKDRAGVPISLPAESAVTTKLAEFSNSTAIALRYIKEFKVLQAQGAGEAYTTAITLYDQQMARAVVMATRALLEAEHSSKADSETGRDVASTFVSYIQRQVEVAFYRDVILTVVKLNWGEDATAYAPLMMLAADTSRDTEKFGTMIAALTSAGYLHESQYPGIDAQIGLPERDLDAQVEEKADKQEARDAQQREMARLYAGPRGAGKLDDGEQDDGEGDDGA